MTRNNLPPERTFYGSLYSRGYLPFYAGAVSDGKKAVLLPGQSGAGKTTTVRHMIERGYLPMGDEFIVLKNISGKLTVYAGEVAFPGKIFNRIRPSILESELVSTVVLLPQGDGSITRFKLSEVGLPFIFKTDVMRLNHWRELIKVISLFLNSEIYVARRPKIDILTDFIAGLLG